MGNALSATAVSSETIITLLDARLSHSKDMVVTEISHALMGPLQEAMERQDQRITKLEEQAAACTLAERTPTFHSDAVAATDFRKGQHVTLARLTNSALNGKTGIISSIMADSGRCAVLLSGETVPKSVKPCNLDLHSETTPSPRPQHSSEPCELCKESACAVCGQIEQALCQGLCKTCLADLLVFTGGDEDQLRAAMNS